ncbi:MAG: YggT family protein [Erythrobacter sp.]|uniref:YggT family protein n=1 Tax=Erythrobacter sp. TaxID=1042 RepID=UPI002630BD0A|nr:YggT family protein [Erythrobacter sp.]MDJ0978199.1 YggT family protein [Erythrobacter sp.]
MAGLVALYQIIDMLAGILVMLIIIQFVISLLFAFNVVSPSNQFLMQVYNSVGLVLDPLLRPIRRIMPDTGAIDFSPIVLIILLRVMLIVLSAVMFSN